MTIVTAVYVLPVQMRCFICNGAGQIEELEEVKGEMPTFRSTGRVIDCRFCHGTGELIVR